jgi:hypothetical protein
MAVLLPDHKPKEPWSFPGAELLRALILTTERETRMNRVLFAAGLIAACAPAYAATLNPWWMIAHRDVEEGGNQCFLAGDAPLDWEASRNAYNERWGLPDRVRLVDKGADEVDLIYLPDEAGNLPDQRFFRSQAACQAALPTEWVASKANRDALLNAVKRAEDKYR